LWTRNVANETHAQTADAGDDGRRAFKFNGTRATNKIANDKNRDPQNATTSRERIAKDEKDTHAIRVHIETITNTHADNAYD